MRHARLVPLALALALLASSPLLAGDAAPTAAPPLHFRLEVGLEPGRFVEGRLAESAPGRGLDTAWLDLGGDGTGETKVIFPDVTRPGSSTPARDARIRIPSDQAIFVLDIEALRSPLTARSLAAGPARADWYVQAGDLLVRFIDGSVELTASAEEARNARAFRLGPPLALTVAAGTRGSGAVVDVDVRDANGADLGMVLRAGKEARPEVRIGAGTETRISATPGYS